MKFSKDKTAIAIALFLMFAMAFSLIALPAATAQEPSKKTYAYIGATPNPVGVGQEVLLHAGITDNLADARYSWTGLTVTVTKPDGKTETLGPYTTDSTGGTGDTYVPTMEGTYKLQTHFPAQVNPADSRVGPEGMVMEASDSEVLELVVQEEPREYYLEHSLPTEYWSRPIDAQLREWYTIAGNWLERPIPSQFAPYNDDAPETPHVLWANPLTIGGLVGGELGDHAYHCGDAYEGKWQTGTRGSIIIAGILLYNEYPANYGTQRVHAVDLRTGEELWTRDDIGSITFGQILYYSSPNQHGAFAYLWCGWDAYDPLTGDWMYSMTDVPSGSRTYGPNGEILIYQVDTKNGWMALWNSTAIPALLGSDVTYGTTDYFQWRPWGKTVNATGPCKVSPENPLGIAGYSWNVTIPKDLQGSVRAVFAQDRVIGMDISATEVNTWALSLEPGQKGSLLYNKAWEPPAGWAAGNVSISWTGASQEDKVGVLWVKEERAYYGLDLNTGSYLWGPTESENYLSIYSITKYHVGMAYGKLFSAGYSGTVYAYDLKTGKLVWNFSATDHYSEILWSNNWPLYMGFITDGKIYVIHTEHSVIDPKPRGAPFICLNATTGEEIWATYGNFRATHWGGRPIIGDNIIAMYNTYDQRIYALGKGPSATTVTASPKVSVHGDSVLVEGMVTDTSPGTEDYALTARFPNGVPAVADENMSAWMEYVYNQFERPADVIGVDVVVEVLDPNNNVYEVGRTTSDASGTFCCEFTPEVPGLYTLIATFEGSKSYWSSNAVAYLKVNEAPVPTPEPTPQPASAADLYFLPMSIATIVAIIVIGLLLFLMIRKR